MTGSRSRDQLAHISATLVVVKGCWLANWMWMNEINFSYRVTNLVGNKVDVAK